jgi:hypothetical protein
MNSRVRAGGMRRRGENPETRSLPSLLARQPATARKHPDFRRLELMLENSSELKRIRLDRSAVRLLDRPRLEPRFLGNFYATYRIKAHPFYALFLEIKWSCAKMREEAAKARGRRIDSIMEACPREVRLMLRYLEALEGARRPESPLFRKGLYPRTLKRAREAAELSLSRWIPLFREHLSALRQGYRTIAIRPTRELIARMILECLPDPRTGRAPPDAAVRASFRSLSKACHPDLGGDASRFRLLAWARDLIIG